MAHRVWTTRSNRVFSHIVYTTKEDSPPVTVTNPEVMEDDKYYRAEVVGIIDGTVGEVTLVLTVLT